MNLLWEAPLFVVLLAAAVAGGRSLLRGFFYRGRHTAAEATSTGQVFASSFAGSMSLEDDAAWPADTTVTEFLGLTGGLDEAIPDGWMPVVPPRLGDGFGFTVYSDGSIENWERSTPTPAPFNLQIAAPVERRVADSLDWFCAELVFDASEFRRAQDEETAEYLRWMRTEYATV